MRIASLVLVVAAAAACGNDKPPPVGWLTEALVQYEDGTPIVGATVEVFFNTFPPEVDLDSGGVIRRRCASTDGAGRISLRLEDEVGRRAALAERDDVAGVRRRGERGADREAAQVPAAATPQLETSELRIRTRRRTDRDRDGVPRGWVLRMKRAMRTLGWWFSSDRMVRDYVVKSYVPAAGGTSSDMSRS